MPVSSSLAVSALSTDEFRELDYRVMRHAFDSQNELGRLADERIYQADLAARLGAAGMTVSREVEIKLLHGKFCKSLFLDLIVAEQAIYELKVVKTINDAHVGQLLTYLHLLDLSRGKLINFRSTTKLLSRRSRGNDRFSYFPTSIFLPPFSYQNLGTQRFHLSSRDIAFKITAMNRDMSDYRSQLVRLIQFSPLRAIHWINIAHHEVTFTTIAR